MRYLLDTNTISDLIRNPQGRVAQHIKRVGDGLVCTSSIVAAELRYGVTKKGSSKLMTRVEAVLGRLAILPFEPPADAAHGLIRTNLEKMGKTIGSNDYLIAAQAIAFGCTLVTDNQAEFSRIDGLVCENWLRS
jgi:tRNA(fMet)-specific endonuclease VapC